MKRKLPSSDDLIRCVCVFNSHEDFSVYEAIYIGYDEYLNLIIMCEHTDYEDTSSDCATLTILNKHEAWSLARRLKSSLPNLPLEIAGYMAEWNEIVCPMPSDVRNCFKEITDCLLEEGCHFRIIRKLSANGFTNM